MSASSTTAPGSGGDPRPGNRPYYIAQNCPTRGAALMLLDEFDGVEVVFHDEWVCPKHRDDGVLMDVPAG